MTNTIANYDYMLSEDAFVKKVSDHIKILESIDGQNHMDELYQFNCVPDIPNDYPNNDIFDNAAKHVYQ